VRKKNSLVQVSTVCALFVLIVAVSTFLPVRALGDIPAQPDKRFELGSFELSERRYKAAIEQFNGVIADDSKNSQAFTKRGISKEKLKDYQGAMKDYDLAVELKNNFALFKRAKLEYKIGKYQSSIDDYSCLLQTHISGWHARYYHGRALAEKRLHRAEEASKDFSEEEKFFGPPTQCTRPVPKHLRYPDF
jgi:tetratricopeptide (TPR) repeat protein